MGIQPFYGICPLLNGWKKVAFKENLTFFCVYYITLTGAGGVFGNAVLHLTGNGVSFVLITTSIFLSFYSSRILFIVLYYMNYSHEW